MKLEITIDDKKLGAAFDAAAGGSLPADISQLLVNAAEYYVTDALANLLRVKGDARLVNEMRQAAEALYASVVVKQVDSVL